MIALKSSKTIQLIIWATTKGPEGSGSTGPTALLMTRIVRFTAGFSVKFFFYFEVISLSNEWCTSASVSGNDRFRNGTLTLAFFGVVAAEMLLIFWLP